MLKLGVSLTAKTVFGVNWVNLKMQLNVRNCIGIHVYINDSEQTKRVIQQQYHDLLC